MNISRSYGVINVNQKTMITALLEKYNLNSTKVADTLLPIGTISVEYSEHFEGFRDYQALIGSLMYIAINSRLDIAYAMIYLSQFKLVI